MTTISTADTADITTKVDLLFAPGLEWHPKAPRAARELYAAGYNPRDWALWQKYLGKRDRQPMRDLVPGKQSPLLWATADADLSGSTRAHVGLLRAIRPRMKRRDKLALQGRVHRWLDEGATPTSPSAAIECLAWCAALPLLVNHLPERSWWALMQRLVDSASGVHSAHGDAEVDPLAQQLVAGELAFALAYNFPELAACRRLAKSGRETISQGMSQLLDGKGLVHARNLPRFRQLLACWTRAQVLARRAKRRWCDAEQAKQYRHVVRHALRLSRGGGQQAFAPHDGPTWEPTLVKTALQFAGDRQTRRMARAALGKSRSAKSDLPNTSPAFEAEWAGLALLRSSWQPSSALLAVDYSGQQVLTELNHGREPVWNGPWSLDVRFNGELLTASEPWEQVCWVSDKDADYLELALDLSPEVTIERHLLLTHKDRFLLMADAVVAIQPGSIDYRATLPLAPDWRFRAESETWEATLESKASTRARVFPLGLPEWRAGRAPGALQSIDGGFEWRLKAEGQSLFAPILIDLDPRRYDKPFTWRQLTIGQDRAIVPSDAAVGYRVQAGKKQWLVYRSLVDQAVRTVLGKNLMTEFLVGRFGAEGNVTTLVEIE